MKKRVLSLLLALVMVLTPLPITALAVTDSEPNDSIPTAQAFAVGDTINGDIAENKDADWYKFTLDNSGCVTFKVTSYIEHYSMWLYDDEGIELWRTYGNAANSSTGMRTDTYNIDLTEGTYYLKVSGEYSTGFTGHVYYSSGSYKIKVDHTNANATETEENNSLSQANTIPLDSTTKGQIAINDNNDYFKIELPADGELTLTFTSYMSHYSIWLFDSDGNEVWKDYGNEWNSSVGSRKDTYSLDLIQDIYYIKVSGEYSTEFTGHVYYSSGNYTLDTDYINANADEEEPNNSIREAQRIPLNKAIDGQIALNNRKDYYQFTIRNEMDLLINMTSYMSHYSIWIYDVDGVELLNMYGKEWDSSTGKRRDVYTIHLTEGTYYMQVSGEYSTGFTGHISYSSGNYTFKLNTENPFTDVSDDSFYYDPVLWAVDQGITNGLSATEFGPDATCNRAQVVTFLWRAAGEPEPTSTENPFVDVAAGSFYEKPVLWAVEKGITNGSDATHFNPGGDCNRAQVVTFLYRAFESPTVNVEGLPFTDVPAGAWYEAPIAWAVENGITNGISATEFGPNTSCNRAQVVTFLYRAYN